MIVVWLFLVMPWVCLQFVIVVFPDHTHYFHKVRQICFYYKQRGSVHVFFGTYRIFANAYNKRYIGA